jgi:hypothetical protein
MSSVRMKTKLGLIGLVLGAVVEQPAMAKINSTVNSADANSRTILLILYSFPGGKAEEENRETPRSAFVVPSIYLSMYQYINGNYLSRLA